MTLKRRQFITLLGGAAAWPLAARAQQRAIPVIGYIVGNGPGVPQGFRQGLAENGFVDGQNVRIDVRPANDQYGRLDAIAQDLVHREVAVIVTDGGAPAIIAAKRATTKIPIAFRTGGDPVQLGIVASLNRPGGNITGVSDMASSLSPKRLDLLLKLVPTATTVAVLLNPTNPTSEPDAQATQAAAAAIGRVTHVFNAGTDAQIDDAFNSIARQRIGALVVNPDPYLTGHGKQIVDLAARYALPAIYGFRSYSEVGGLMSYGASLPDSRRQLGQYVGRILKGANPADLPILQPTKFELLINLKTAKVLGLTVPDTLLALADEVIE